MPQIKKVKTIEEAGQTSKGSVYWKVTWDDDKSDNIFDVKFKETLETALAHNLPVNVEKEKNGQYWNVKSVTPAGVEMPSEASQAKSIPPSPQSNVIDRFNAEDIRIRSMCLSYAKDLLVAGKITSDILYSQADRFYQYIISGKIEVKKES